MNTEKIFIPHSETESAELLKNLKINFSSVRKACCFSELYQQGVEGTAVELGYLMGEFPKNQLLKVFDKKAIRFYPEAGWLTFHLHSPEQDMTTVKNLWSAQLCRLNKPYTSFNSVMIAEIPTGVEIFGSVFEDAELTDGAIFEFIHQSFPGFRTK